MGGSMEERGWSVVEDGLQGEEGGSGEAAKV